MAKLGKILGPVVVVLALAAAVMSFMAARQRAMFRERAAVLAQGMQAAADKLNDGTGSEKTKALTFAAASDSSPKEGGSLGWEEYKKSAKAADGAYKKNVDQLAALSAEVVQQRSVLIASVLDMAKELGCPEEMLPTLAEMTRLGKYQECLGLLQDYTRKVAERDAKMVEGVQAIGKIVSTDVSGTFAVMDVQTDADGKKSLGEFKIDEAFGAVRGGVEGVQKRSAAMAGAIAGLSKDISNQKWTFSVARVQRGDDLQAMLGELTKLKSDLQEINKRLANEERLQTEREALNQKVREMENQIADLESQNKELAEKARKADLTIGLSPEDPSQRTEKVESMEDVDRAAIGKVKSTDRDFGYVVVSLTNRQVMNGVMLTVMRGGQYAATVKVTKAGDDFSIADVVNGRIADIAADDDVVVSSANLQGSKLLSGNN